MESDGLHTDPNSFNCLNRPLRLPTQNPKPKSRNFKKTGKELCRDSIPPETPSRRVWGLGLIGFRVHKHFIGFRSHQPFERNVFSASFQSPVSPRNVFNDMFSTSSFKKLKELIQLFNEYLNVLLFRLYFSSLGVKRKVVKNSDFNLDNFESTGVGHETLQRGARGSQNLIFHIDDNFWPIGHLKHIILGIFEIRGGGEGGWGPELIETVQGPANMLERNALERKFSTNVSNDTFEQTF